MNSEKVENGVLFKDFILKCDCSFLDKLFVTDDFKSDLSRTNLKLPQCELAVGKGCISTKQLGTLG